MYYEEILGDSDGASFSKGTRAYTSFHMHEQSQPSKLRCSHTYVKGDSLGSNEWDLTSFNSMTMEFQWQMGSSRTLCLMNVMPTHLGRVMLVIAF